MNHDPHPDLFRAVTEQQMTAEQRVKFIAMEAFGLVEHVGFENHYFCMVCEESWVSDWTCMVDDDCPKCGLAISPEHCQELYSLDDIGHLG